MRSSTVVLGLLVLTLVVAVLEARGIRPSKLKFVKKPKKPNASIDQQKKVFDMVWKKCQNTKNIRQFGKSTMWYGVCKYVRGIIGQHMPRMPKKQVDLNSMMDKATNGAGLSKDIADSIVNLVSKYPQNNIMYLLEQTKPLLDGLSGNGLDLGDLLGGGGFGGPIDRPMPGLGDDSNGGFGGALPRPMPGIGDDSNGGFGDLGGGDLDGGDFGAGGFDNGGFGGAIARPMPMGGNGGDEGMEGGHGGFGGAIPRPMPGLGDGGDLGGGDLDGGDFGAGGFGNGGFDGGDIVDGGFSFGGDGFGDGGFGDDGFGDGGFAFGNGGFGDGADDLIAGEPEAPAEDAGMMNMMNRRMSRRLPIDF